MMHPKPLPLSYFVDRLDRGEPVTYVRYGDGEFSALLGRDGETCDGQPYTRELGMDLLRTLAQPRGYLYALGPRAAQGLGIDVEAFMRRRGLKIDWHDSEVFIDASTRGDLFPLVAALRKRRVLTVGPAHLRKHPAYDAVAFVETPAKDAYRALRRLYLEVMREAYKADVICFSAGPVAKILIHDLSPHLGQSHSLLDLGSVFDWYAGVDSRGYMRRMDAETRERLRRANLGGV